jgi:hypothetical protein
MKHINNYQKFRDEQVNEEWNIMAALRSATGAFKGFLTGLAAPFKNLKDDFKKGLKREELKKKVSVMLDTLLKSTTDSINKAEDEAALTSIATGFTKEFDDKCVEIDKEIQSVKESKDNLILEGSIKDGMIAGRVMLGMVKQKAAELKMEFDKKVAVAKDLAGKKAARIAEVKAIVDDFKKKITDDKYLDAQIAKYKTDNKIEGGAEVEYKVDDVILVFGDKWDEKKGEDSWKALSDDEKKKPKEGKLKELIDNEVIAIRKIMSIGTNNVTTKDADGEGMAATFNKSDILAKVEGDETAAYKAGDSVIYKRDKWEPNKAQEVWDKLTDDEKKKPNEGKLKELIDKESAGIKVIKAVEKDFVRITDVSWVKDNDEILGKVDNKVDGQVDVQNNLKEIKTKNPARIADIKTFTDFVKKADDAKLKAMMDNVKKEMGEQ